jgi:hypothetical protein
MVTIRIVTLKVSGFLRSLKIHLFNGSFCGGGLKRSDHRELTHEKVFYRACLRRTTGRSPAETGLGFCRGLAAAERADPRSQS